MADYNRLMQKNNPVWNSQTRQTVNTFPGSGAIILNSGSTNIRPDTNYMIIYNSGAAPITIFQMISDGAGGATMAANGIVVVAGASFEIGVDYGASNMDTATEGDGVGITVAGTNTETFVATYYAS